jgi:hypothetical protein
VTTSRQKKSETADRVHLPIAIRSSVVQETRRRTRNSLGTIIDYAVSVMGLQGSFQTILSAQTFGVRIGSVLEDSFRTALGKPLGKGAEC